MPRRAGLVPDLPPGTGLALHACCAPCAGGIISALRDAEIAVTVIWANANMDDATEYRCRQASLAQFCADNAVPFVSLDDDHHAWLAALRGLEDEPERGQRCERCFTLRLTAAAAWAHDHRFPLLATALGIARQKDLDQVHRAGQAAVMAYAPVRFLAHNWRRGGGTERMQTVAKTANFYRQNYCGCPFSRG